MRVKTVMRTPPLVVSPHTPLTDAAARLVVEPAQCALVVDSAGLRGVLTPSDVRRAGPSTIAAVARREGQAGARALEVADAMRPAASILASDATLQEAARRMRDARAAELPVVDGEEPVGVLTAAILLPLAIAELDRVTRPGLERSLVVVDSEDDVSLVATAVRLCPGGVEVVHVLPPLLGGRSALLPDSLRTEVAAARRRHAAQWLARFLARAPGAPAQGHVREGEATRAIVDLASDGLADVIVVRRRSRCVETLTRVAPCPVLAL